MSRIKITEAYFQPVGKKLNITVDFENEMQSIDLKEFTNQFETLFIIFQCFPKDTKSRKVEECKIQRRKTNTLELYLVLDYEQIMQGSDGENLTYIKEVFLKGCETFLKPLKGFDWERFEAKMDEVL